MEHGQQSQAALRTAFGSYVTGVTVAATLDGSGAPRGFTANSFTSVSLEPPLLSVSIAQSAASHDAFAGSQAFAISVLTEEQSGLSRLFASKAPDKFAQAAWRPGRSGCPILEGAAAWFDCETYQAIPAGDHTILLGRVVAFHAEPAHPLIYYRGGYVKLSLSQEAVATAHRVLTVGAILDCQGAILFLRNPDGRLALPAAGRIGSPEDRDSLLGALNSQGVEATLTFIFAVFEGRKPADGVSIYYRGFGELRASLPASRAILLNEADIPWSEIGDEAVTAMLRRYFKERGEDLFGVYVGGAEQGLVKPLAKAAPSFGAADCGDVA